MIVFLSDCTFPVYPSRSQVQWNRFGIRRSRILKYNWNLTNGFPLQNARFLINFNFTDRTFGFYAWMRAVKYSPNTFECNPLAARKY
jgi:hypothetical protein